MDITIRTPTRDDFEAIARVDEAAFGEEMRGERLEQALTVLDPNRFLVACDDDRIVGVAGDYPFTVTVPGGSGVDVRGVTWVSVDVTHRRRGVLTALMQEQLGGFRQRGIAASILLASEGGIYGRFGYGVATPHRTVAIHRRRARLRQPGDASRVRRLTSEQARPVLPAIWDRWRAQVPGGLDRTDAWWDVLLADKEFQRRGMSPLFHLVHADGYVSYRIKSEWGDGDPRNSCFITDYAIASEEAHRDLWTVLLGLDLVAEITSFKIPVDDPLPLLLTDGRQVRTTALEDAVWLRALDVAALLRARTYAIEVDAVIEVRDALFGSQRVRLSTGTGGSGTAEPTDAEPDVSFEVDAFGSAYLGGGRLTQLAAAGKVQADDPALLSRLDRALLADRSPVFCMMF